MKSILIQTYSAELQTDFIRLNENWIQSYFQLEESDVKVLSNPKDKIVDPGGEIFFAIDTQSQAVVGCCALIRHSAGHYELAKMAVDPTAQSKGIGFLLGATLIAEARKRGAKHIFLEGNTRMTASIHLYRKLGFKETEIDYATYKRCDIKMELNL